MYRTNQEFVPVAPYNDTWKDTDPNDQPRYIREPRFEIVPADNTPGGKVTPAKSITMKFSLNIEGPRTEVQVDIPFIMQEDHNDISVVYVHGMVDEMELSDVMLIAYWEKDEYDSWDEYKESLNTALHKKSESKKHFCAKRHGP